MNEAGEEEEEKGMSIHHKIVLGPRTWTDGSSSQVHVAA